MLGVASSAFGSAVITMAQVVVMAMSHNKAIVEYRIEELHGMLHTFIHCTYFKSLCPVLTE